MRQPLVDDVHSMFFVTFFAYQFDYLIGTWRNGWILTERTVNYSLFVIRIRRVANFHWYTCYSAVSRRTSRDSWQKIPIDSAVAVNIARFCEQFFPSAANHASTIHRCQGFGVRKKILKKKKLDQIRLVFASRREVISLGSWDQLTTTRLLNMYSYYYETETT